MPYGLRHSTEQFQAQKYAPPRLPYGVFKKKLPCHQFLWCGDGNFGVVDGVVNGVVDYKSYRIIWDFKPRMVILSSVIYKLLSYDSVIFPTNSYINQIIKIGYKRLKIKQGGFE